MKEEALARSQLYAGLARAFRKPESPPEESEDSLAPVLQRVAVAAAVALDAPALGRMADEVAESLELAEESDPSEEIRFLQALEIEYNRLFVGPGRPEAAPYESVYRDPHGQVMGPATRDVVRHYREAGLAPASDHHDLPDHVAMELSFMAYLALEESTAQGEEAQIWLEKEQTFLQEHLGTWLPLFCQRVTAASRHPFYTALARLTSAFVDLDAQQLDAGQIGSISKIEPISEGMGSSVKAV
jgi:DMSO reductase family type II enzyme chaperone